MPRSFNASRLFFCCLIPLTVAAGCAAPAAPAPQGARHADCLVCVYNADLACIDVDVDDQTPTAEFAGQRFYFCSDECGREFDQHPQKFVRR